MPTAPHRTPKFHNRLRAVMDHTSRYAFRGPARLARDCGVSRSAISRLLSGENAPSFSLMLAVTENLEKALGKRLDPRELLSLSGTYPTASVCRLCGCRGCLPREAYREDDTLKPEYRDVRPGEWLPAPPVPPAASAPASLDSSC